MVQNDSQSPNEGNKKSKSDQQFCKKLTNTPEKNEQFCGLLTTLERVGLAWQDEVGYLTQEYFKIRYFLHDLIVSGINTRSGQVSILHQHNQWRVGTEITDRIHELQNINLHRLHVRNKWMRYTLHSPLPPNWERTNKCRAAVQQTVRDDVTHTKLMFQTSSVNFVADWRWLPRWWRRWRWVATRLSGCLREMKTYR